MDLSNPLPEEDSQGTLSDLFANPWVSIPSAVGLGLLGASAPNRGTGHLASGINGMLQLGLGAEKEAYARKKSKRLGDAMATLAGATQDVPVTKTGLDPNTTTFESLPAGTRLNDVYPMDSEAILRGQPQVQPSLPTYDTTEKKPVFSPLHRQLLEATSRYAPEKGFNLASKLLVKDVHNPMAVRSGGAIVDLNTGKVIYSAPAEAKPTPAPHFATLGGEGVQSVWNPSTQQWEITRTPLTAAPARESSPELLADREHWRRIQESVATETARHNAAMEALQKERSSAGGGANSTTERERAMKPEDQAIAETMIAETADKRGVHKLPAKDQPGALKKIAADYGMELEGDATLTPSGVLFGNAGLRGSFNLRPKPLVTKTERTKSGANVGRNNDPLGIR